MSASFPAFLDVFRRHRKTRRSSRRPPRGRSHLGSERLEPRALLSITTISAGPTSNSLIVAASPDAPGVAASDVFIQRRADGQLLIADNSSFLANVNFHQESTPDLLYVTNAATQTSPTLRPGDSRSVANGGPGLGLDPVLSKTTNFVFQHGSIVPTSVNGTLSYNGRTWAFPGLAQLSGPPGGPQPIFATVSSGGQDSPSTSTIGRGQRGYLTVEWSADVATVEHTAPGVAAPPKLTVTYAADNDAVTPFFGDYPIVNQKDILPSASSTPSFQFDNGGSGAIVAGTLRGEVYVNTPQIGGGTVGVSFPFAADVLGGSTLYFGGRPFGENDWLRVTGTYTPGSPTAPFSTISLTFDNRYTGFGTGTTPTTDTSYIPPGPVEIRNLSFLRHDTAALPSSFTLFAGHDLPSQVHVDLTASGSTINIDSPIVVSDTLIDPDSATRDIEFRATNVNLNAKVSSTDDFFIGPSAVTGTPAEIVHLNAALSVPGQCDIKVANDPANDFTGGPLKGELIVSQSGRISGQLAPLSIPFGDNGVSPITSETEPNSAVADSQNLMGSFTRIGDETYRASVTGTISPSTDRDWFNISVRPDDLVTIELEGTATGAGTLNDPLVRLTDSTGTTTLASDDDSGVGLNSKLEYRVPLPGPADPPGARTLHVIAGPYGSNTGTYKLTVTVSRKPAVPTGVLVVDALASDVYVEGTVFATNQSWLMQSSTADNTKVPYTLTTLSKGTAGRTGLIQGGTIAITLGNDAETPLNNAIAYNVLDLDTDVDSLRVKASTRLGDPNPRNAFPYSLTVRETDDLVVDAVAASSLPISLAADGDISMSSSVETAGGIEIVTRRTGLSYGAFQAAAAMTTLRGSIDITARSILVANTLAVTDAVVDPSATDISLVAVDGNIDLNGLVSTPNNVSLRQQTNDSKAGRVQGNGLIAARNLDVVADAVGNAIVRPDEPLFFLQTQVDTVTGDVANGFAIHEKDDVTISQLRVPAGTVSLVADGTDGRAGSPNPIALTANGIDVASLIVSTPNGSLDVRIDTGKDLVLGDAASIRDGRSVNMLAAGDARIRSSAGPIRVLDAPFAGSGARQVRRQSASAITGTYTAGTPGVIASQIQVVDAKWQERFSPTTFGVGDRVLIGGGVTPDGIAPADLTANGVYSVLQVGTSTTPWILKRASDSDTLAELPSGTIVKVTEEGVYRRLSHGIASAAGFGTSPITVDATVPKTNIGSNLPLPDSVVEFVVSSTAGTNSAPGSLGKMITLRQQNDTTGGPNPDQPMTFSFSPLVVGGTIQLTDELPTIVKPVVGTPLTIDGGRLYSSAYAVTGSAATNVITAPNHQFVENQAVIFQSLTGGLGLTVNSPVYYVRNIAGDTFQVALTSGGTAVDFATDITAGSVTATNIPIVSPTAIAVTGNAATNVITAVNHPYVQNQAVFFQALTGGAGLNSNTATYYVVNVVGNTFQVSLTPSGTPVDFTTNITGGFVQSSQTSNLTILGTFINRTNDGVSKVTQTYSARPLTDLEKNTLGLSDVDARHTLVVADTALRAVATGMAVSSVGVRAGARVGGVVLSRLSPGTGTVTLTELLDTTWTSGSRSVTFATEINGFHFGADAVGASLANLALGGFGSGAAIMSMAPASNGSPGVTIRDVRTGQDWAGNRYGNEFGVLVAGNGSALVSGGVFTSSAGAGIRTQDTANNVVLDGVTVGSAALFNVVGVELAGSGEVKLGSSDANGRRNVISGNRVGVVLRNGTNRILRTTVSQNSFEGVKIDGGNYQIGDSTTLGATSNEITANGGWGLNIASAVVPANPQTDSPLRRIQGNYLGVGLNGQTSVNRAGNVAVDDVAARGRVGLRPRASGLDAHGNLHAVRPTRPTMYVAEPLDNSVNDSSDNVDNLVSVGGEAARITRLVLGLEDDNNAINPSSVVAGAFTVQYSPSKTVTDWNGSDVKTWASGTDYTFRYDATARQAYIEVAAGLPAGSYRVVVNNTAATGVRDTNGNALLPNDVAGVGTTAFTVVLDPTTLPTDPDVYVIDGGGVPLFVVDGNITRDAQSILITNAGSIRINGIIQASQPGRRITIRATGGHVEFGPAGELRATNVLLEAASSSQLRVGAGAVVASATVSAGDLELMARGALRQSGPISAQGLVISEIGGPVTLDNAGNAVNTFAVTAALAGATVTFVNSKGFTVTNAGVSAGTAASFDGGISLTAAAGDLFVDGPLNAPGDIAFLQAAGRVTFGPNYVKNVQTLVVQDSNGPYVVGAFLVGDAAGFARAVAVINGLPPSLVPYPIVIAASFTLDQTLTINRPVDLSVQSAGLTITGSATAPSGLVFTSSAAGTRVIGLTFQNFSGTALFFDGVKNLTIQGLTVIGGGTGLRLANDMTGSTVTGSRFTGVKIAMQLENLRSVTIGGTVAAQRNRIEGATQVGVVATGFCTGTRVIGTTFAASPRTRTQFNTRSARGLRVTGTVTERTRR